MLVDKSGNRSSIAVTSLGSITRVGRCLRRFKIDELPQLFNVLIGDMSFVGPRPDVSGYADFLNGHDRLILELRPGITGPASIKYKNEEEILMGQEDPVDYNNNVIWPDKVAINLKYYHERTLKGDIKLILETIFH
jgi:lipopolysaccharide/colanic/teichoic acid biosynthesis glycosyltransferase